MSAQLHGSVNPTESAPMALQPSQQEPENHPGRPPLPPTPYDDITVNVRVLEAPRPDAPAHFEAKVIADWPNPPPSAGAAPPTAISNVEHLLREHEITARYNGIKKKVEVVLPSHVAQTDNSDVVAMTHIISAAALNKLGTGHIPAYVEAVADSNLYNPVADWIRSRAWDGEDRLEALYATIETVSEFSESLKRTLMYRWLLSATAAALKQRDFKARGVLTIQGPQGIGKTSWIRSLVDNSELREATIKVDHHLDVGNKDTILGAISHWIVELGELDSTFRKDVARLKGFLTSDQDKVRRPYARGESEYARRTVFAATVNETNFLVDMTGNTRWWTIPATRIHFQHGIDMQQVFAQLALDFSADKQWWLTSSEETELEAANASHLAVSAIREGLLSFIDPQCRGQGDYMSTTEVLKQLGIQTPTNAQSKECTQHLRDLLGDSKRVNGSQKWRIPFRKVADVTSLGDFPRAPPPPTP